MNILITGAAGFIGSHLAEAYHHLGHRVWGVDSFETGRADNWNAAPIDITDRRVFYEYANELKPHLIVHCAASYKDPDKWHRDTDVNVAGAINVAAAAKHHGARIVYFQTVLPPISSYAISKIAGEHYLRLSGQPLTVYRLASVYGPRNLSGPIPTFYRRISAGEPCTVVEGVTRDFVFVDDLVRVVLANERDGTIDIRSGNETRIDILPYHIAHAMGIQTLTPIPQLIPRPVDDVQQYDMSGPPIATIEIEDGIEKTVRWYEQHGVGETYTHLQLGKERN